MKTVFTNGVFDIIHRGHVELLEFCKTQGDYLIVAIDSDERVKKTKGMSRPINTVEDRKKILQSIRFVDEVVVFNTHEELKEFHALLKPDVVVKGSDWNLDFIRQTDAICDNSKLILFNRLENYSSTSIIERF
jgi:D-beta-D-heptose 7-phosphate kinase/D-beta-D-heptose 1-phosphate adenosyltransferase